MTDGHLVDGLFVENPLAYRAPVIEADVVEAIGFMGGHEEDPLPFGLGPSEDRGED